MSTPSISWRETHDAARARRARFRREVRTTILPTALRAAIVGAAIGAAIQWAAPRVFPYAQLTTLEILTAVALGLLILAAKVAPFLLIAERTKYLLDQHGVRRNGTLILRWTDFTSFVRVTSESVPGGSDVLLSRRTGPFIRVPLPADALEQEVLSAFAAHGPQLTSVTEIQNATPIIGRSLSGLEAIGVYSAIAVCGFASGYAFAKAFWLLRDFPLGRELLLYLAPLAIGPGTAFVIYEWRRSSAAVRPALALGLLLNMASSAIAGIFALLFLLRDIAGI